MTLSSSVATGACAVTLIALAACTDSSRMTRPPDRMPPTAFALVGPLPNPPPSRSAGLDPGILLTLPACVPRCTLADGRRLLADLTIEDMFVNAVQSARRSVDLSTFTFSRPRIMMALVAAADRGVRVRGVVDRSQFKTIGSACTPSGCTFASPFDTAAFLAKSPSERCRDAQEKRLWPMDATVTEKLAVAIHGLENGSGVRPGPAGRLVHNKLILVDDDLLVTGSANFSSTGLSLNLENFDVVTRRSDPKTVRAFACMFDVVYAGQPTTLQRALEACQTDRVFFTPAKGIVPVILDAVKGAQRSIEICMHHLVDVGVLDALAEAARRKVTVRILMDDDACMERTPAGIRELDKAGAELRVLGTSCELFQLVHHKFGVFDREVVINGPANWTKAGLRTNFENFIVYDDPGHLDAFVASFDTVWALGVPRRGCGCDPALPACRKRFCLDRELPH